MEAERAAYRRDQQMLKVYIGQLEQKLADVKRCASRHVQSIGAMATACSRIDRPWLSAPAGVNTGSTRRAATRSNGWRATCRSARLRTPSWFVPHQPPIS